MAAVASAAMPARSLAALLWCVYLQRVLAQPIDQSQNESLTETTWKDFLEQAWEMSSQRDALSSEAVQGISFLDPPMNGDPRAEGLVYQETNDIIRLSPNSIDNEGTWLKWYPRLGALKDGTTHVQMLGSNISWEPDMWAFNASLVQPPLPPASSWPEAAKVISGYAFGGPSPTGSKQFEPYPDTAQRIFSTTPSYYRLTPFAGVFGTSVRLMRPA
eukprot:TRINITY_DN24383_c0_g1_i1.p1 TRINITY_DN24383_c0_g1~~TRINITY_DN24383_c0_g1_i1.p1  ORF type:complete len:216 (-),score=30.17 TRINITY_DN24383_c0_g1_i1:170-817(-)